MIAKYFEFDKYSTNMKTEFLAGLTSFLASMYIIVVNPAILSNAGLPFSGVLTATVLVTFFSSMMMGLYAKNPIIVAPAMGINTFFTFTVCINMNVSWEIALGAVFWAGVFFMLLSVFNVRTYIVQAIPKQLRYAISAGIGLFITLVGFANAKFIVPNSATMISVAKMNPIVITFLVGLIITSILVIKRIKGALIFGIIATTILAIPIGRIWGDASAINFGVSTLVTFGEIFSMPDFSLIGKLDLVNSLTFALFPVIFAFVFTDMFDSLSTFVGVAEAADLYDESGEPRNIKKALIADAFSTTISGLLGTSSGSAFIESATGIEEGGRTGMTAVIAACCFLPFMFLSPLLSIVPAIATAPALVLMGVFMCKPITKINWSKYDDAIPAFLALVLIPFTSSITQGIIWGFLSWTAIKLILGKRDEVTTTMLIIDAFAILALTIE